MYIMQAICTAAVLSAQLAAMQWKSSCELIVSDSVFFFVLLCLFNCLTLKQWVFLLSKKISVLQSSFIFIFYCISPFFPEWEKYNKTKKLSYTLKWTFFFIRIFLTKKKGHEPNLKFLSYRILRGNNKIGTFLRFFFEY